MADTSKIDPRIEAEGIRVRADVPLEDIVDRHFRNEDVWLDGRRFIRCRFTACRLHVAWGLFTFVQPIAVDPDCLIVTNGLADTVHALVRYVDDLRRGPVH